VHVWLSAMWTSRAPTPGSHMRTAAKATLTGCEYSGLLPFVEVC
jgi:hypothetical protein